MRNKLLIILTLLPIICFSQSSKNKLFGVDLDLDWYSLTNQQTLAYWSQDHDTSSKYVITGCDYILNKIDDKFLSLNFNEMLLIFPKGFKGKLNGLYPEMFLSRISYKDINDYKRNSSNDVNKIFKLLYDTYGKAELNMVKDKYSVYKWVSQIILTTREDELTTTLIFTKE
jgi:hypothetical protein